MQTENIELEEVNSGDQPWKFSFISFVVNPPLQIATKINFRYRKNKGFPEKNSSLFSLRKELIINIYISTSLYISTFLSIYLFTSPHFIPSPLLTSPLSGKILLLVGFSILWDEEKERVSDLFWVTEERRGQAWALST